MLNPVFKKMLVFLVFPFEMVEIPAFPSSKQFKVGPGIYYGPCI